ncbi:maleylpyruvate isomerase family mycothiol-dependent enzyme [Gordonia sp. NPDC058843]|uniref:maleylpyruvate isomerase family mycothiol-dependent enzyme n=1 Tax=Gordonia sp. NPDC058843 TaxID=3346648 RepID=UPI0036C89A26
MGEESLARAIDDFTSGAEHLTHLVDLIADDRWDGPGLGDWSLRSLVGHASRSLTTVVSYLAQPGSGIDLESTAAYFASIRGYGDPASVRQRGVDAGLALGEDPRAGVVERRAEVIEVLVGMTDRPVQTPFGGIMLSDYLPTRTFELAVHGLDISRAIGSDLPLPPPVLASALSTAAATAALTGQGEQVLLTLTGRESAPISIV